MTQTRKLQRWACIAVLAAALPMQAWAVDLAQCKSAEDAVWDVGGYTESGEADIRTHIEILNLFPDTESLREYMRTTIAMTRQYQVQSAWDDANRALLTCLAEHRIAEIQRNAPAPVADEDDGRGDDAVADAPEACSAETASAVNDAIADIDARVARFLETPLGKQQGSATPMLQVVMWATSEQAAAIKADCADNPAYAKRVRELDASYASALQACRQLRSDPDTCGPLSPEDTLRRFPFTEADQRKLDEEAKARSELEITAPDVPRRE